MHVIISLVADAVVVLVVALVAIEALLALRHPRRPEVDRTYQRTRSRYVVDADPGFRQLGMSGIYPPNGGSK
jgi:hypothetical protein